MVGQHRPHELFATPQVGVAPNVKYATGSGSVQDAESVVAVIDEVETRAAGSHSQAE